MASCSMKESDFEKVPLEKLKAVPDRDGIYQLYKNRYWVVVDDCALFYRGSPQCNSNKSIVDQWMFHREIFPGARTVLIENVWRIHNCECL